MLTTCSSACASSCSDAAAAVACSTADPISGPELTPLPELTSAPTTEARTLVVNRGAMRVVVNLGPEPVTLSLGATITRILLASEPTRSEDDSFTVPAEAFAICRIAT